MKLLSTIIAFICVLSQSINAQSYRVEHAFALKEIPAIIEGMTYDPVGGNFYFGESVSFKILRYTKAGKPAGYIDAASDGLSSVLGMSVDTKKNQLWVCGAINKGADKRRCIFQYSLKDGKLIQRYPDTSGKAKLFNDITITTDGSVYCTDTYTKSLYTIDTQSKIAMLYLQSDSLEDGNGISADGNILYVSTSKGITQVNTKDKSISLTKLENFMIAGNDGLYYYKGSVIGIQNVFYPISIARYFLDSEGKKISKAETMAAGHPSFVIPTTGAIVGDYLYFMSNNNLMTEDPKTGRPDKNKVKEVRLARIYLGTDLLDNS